jgi:hypothetical protein
MTTERDEAKVEGPNAPATSAPGAPKTWETPTMHRYDASSAEGPMPTTLVETEGHTS